MNWNINATREEAVSVNLIIVQCLNWNCVKCDTLCREKNLIIVQCLNWNAYRFSNDKNYVAYNRTMLELKYNLYYVSNCCNILIIVQCLNWNGKMLADAKYHLNLIIVQCLNWNNSVAADSAGCRNPYNRTMLELKFYKRKHIYHICHTAYNRTMLELKLSMLALFLRQLLLIIVQCLNWNHTIITSSTSLSFL